MKNLGIFVDLSNLYLTVSKNFSESGKATPKVDFRKYYHYFDDYGKVSIAIAYGAYLEGEENSISSFRNHLELTGFRCNYKKIKEYYNKDTYRRKADQDVNITIDAIRHIDKYDVFILGSGDGDFLPLINYLKDHNKKIFIFAIEMSKDLKEKADAFFTITRDILYNNSTIGPR